MPSFDIIKKSKINNTFRNKSIKGQFDLSINFAFVYGLEDTTIGTVTVKGDIEDGKYLVEETITE